MTDEGEQPTTPAPPPPVVEQQEVLLVELPPSPAAPAAARRALRELAADHPAVASQLDSLLLLVSELVTNATEHPEAADGATMTVSVAIAEAFIRVVVSDGGNGFEPPAAPPPETEAATVARAQAPVVVPDIRTRGYGLVLLGALASRWGTLAAPGRFSVWFELDQAGSAEPR